MNTYVSGTARAFLSLTAAVLSGVILFGCGTGGAGTGVDDSGGTEPGVDGGILVNGDGEAWINDADGDFGIVFNQNSSFSMITDGGDGTWDVYLDGAYTTSGDRITRTLSGEQATGTYSVSGKTLTLTLQGESTTFTKTSNVNISTTPAGSRLILSPGEAWISADSDHGLVFLAGGTALYLEPMNAEWKKVSEGAYEITGVNITIDWGGYYTQSARFSVSGGATLTLTYDDGSKDVLLRTPVIIVNG